MATNVYRKYAGFRNEEWVVPAGTVANDVVLNQVNGRPGVALTSPGGTDQVSVVGNVTIAAEGIGGGVGNKEGAATVGVEGYDFLLTVAGVTEGETVAGTGTPQGTAVYATEYDGAVTELTLTEGTNIKIGVIADGNIIGTVAPVSIGVAL